MKVCPGPQLDEQLSICFLKVNGDTEADSVQSLTPTMFDTASIFLMMKSTTSSSPPTSLWISYTSG